MGREAEIESVKFTAVRFGEGYHMDDVDDLLDRLVVAEREGRSLAPLIQATELRVVRFREAYSIAEVDDFLRKLAAGG